jgi:hypothetical protein
MEQLRKVKKRKGYPGRRAGVDFLAEDKGRPPGPERDQGPSTQRSWLCQKYEKA